MATNDPRKNIKIDADGFRTLKACKPAGMTWTQFLVDSVRDSSDHLPVVRERSGPRFDYVACDLCGRSENDLNQLEARPCDPSGISAKE
jgi:hypothetical protein